MSWYVYYYIGYKTKEGKIYPFFPFDSFGNLKPVITRSRSFASDLWREFDRITLDETTEEIKRYFPQGEYYLFEKNFHQTLAYN